MVDDQRSGLLKTYSIELEFRIGIELGMPYDF